MNQDAATPPPTKHTSWMSYANGKKYERIAQDLLAKHFPHAAITYCAGDDPLSVDFKVDDVRVEVKGSKPRVIGAHAYAFQFLLQSASKGPHVESDVTLLLCVDQEREQVDTFVIPTAHIAGGKCITISCDPQKYKGKYAVYRENWKQMEMQFVHVVAIGTET